MLGAAIAWQVGDARRYHQFVTQTTYSGSDDSEHDRSGRLWEELHLAPSFSTAKYGLGRIVATTAEDPFRLSPNYWRFMQYSIGRNRQTWLDRHGIALNAPTEISGTS